jgi:putative heme-binding domain-containing protein
MNGFTYGLDNRLYAAGGDPSRLVRSELLGRDVKLLGSDFRIEPDTGKIESEGGRSQFVRSRDDWGHWFGNDNTHPWWHYVMTSRALARNPHVRFPRSTVDTFHTEEPPPVFPSSSLAARFNDLNTANRFTSACSPIIFRDDALGPDVTRTGFICEPVHNLIQQIRLERDGLTYRASRIPSDENREFLASTDHWFRPVRVETGPDGALWVADMYRQVIEHPEWIPDHWRTQLDLRAGSDRGRIYRIYRSGRRPGTWPQLSRMSNKDLVDQLSQANGTLRDMAQQLLIERKAIDVAGLLMQVVETGSTPESQVHALWILNALKKLEPHLIEKALFNAHPQLAIQAIRICAESMTPDSAKSSKLFELADHPDLEVRFELAIALGNIADPRSGPALVKILLQSPEEIWIQTAVMSSAVLYANDMLQHLMSQPLPGETRQKFVAQLLATIIATNDDGFRTILELIAKQSTLAETGFPLVALAELVESLERRKMSLADLARTSGTAAENLSRINEWFSKARRIAADPKTAAFVRIAAIRVLGRGIDHQSEDLAVLTTLVSTGQSTDIQLAALKSLGTLNVPEVSRLLISTWKQQSPSTQAAIAQTLLARTEWTKEFIQALEEGRINSRDLSAAERQRLIKNSNDDIATRATKIFKALVSESRQKVLADYSSVENLAGNDLRGSEIFKKSCANCHKYRGLGNQIGGNLMSLQDRSTKALLTAIFDPNQAVEGKFRSYGAVLKDGRMLTGMIVEESTSNIVLASSNGSIQTLLRSEIDEISSSGLSFMPEGLERDLKPQDVADVITFLQADPNSLIEQTSTK